MSGSVGSEPRTAEEQVSLVLSAWAAATQTGAHDEVLRNHEPDVVVFDVLPPMQYVGADAYRASWDDWQPDTEGDFSFELHDLKVAAGDDVAFAYGFIRCAGRTVEGRQFEDRVRATFCLRKHVDGWRVAHQHISMPQGTP
jgi:ketosteroid isomerase-like protein